MVRRSKKEILIAMKEFLEESDFIGSDKAIYKSDFRVKGIDPSTAEEFIKIIIFCQTQFPSIDVIKTAKNLMIRPRSKDRLRTPFEKELIERVQNRQKRDPEYLPAYLVDYRFKYGHDKSHQQESKLTVKFRCVDCEIESDYPEHCNEPMEYDTNENLLKCWLCGLTQSMPVHHNKIMKILIEKRRDDQDEKAEVG